MKNVHILPTDKPSRLFYNVGGALLFTSYESRNGVDIYITSDEEIKEGDWFYLDDAIIVTKYINVKPDKEAQKIILTTNQDLIKDGVQAIDDTFLEWFVKNPSCEEVEVDKNWNYPLDKSWEYKIITPKEEQCSCKVGEPYNNACCKIHGSIPKKEPKQDLEKEMFELEKQLDIPSSMRWYNSKPKQEITLEEAAENNYPTGDVWTEEQAVIRRLAFKACAKWMQERMYSEEEVKHIVLEALQPFTVTVDLNQWFEQFKKKTQ